MQAVAPRRSLRDTLLQGMGIVQANRPAGSTAVGSSAGSPCDCQARRLVVAVGFGQALCNELVKRGGGNAPSPPHGK